MRNILLFLLVFISLYSQAQKLTNSSTDRLKQHIAFLADDRLAGRNTGTEGADKARNYITSQFYQIGLKPHPLVPHYIQSFNFRDKGANPHHTETDETKAFITGYNVVGYIDNKASETIVIGAHYDHLGHGESGGSLYKDDNTSIHNGADDNASGVALMIELANVLQKKKNQKNNYLFIAFSGEELGLLGSNHFVKDLKLDFTKINAMINLDMVGRMKDSTLIINGVGTATEWADILNEAKPEYIKYKNTESGVGPSDHTSFYLQNVPVLHFFSGSHSDYHKPSDDIDKINWSGIVDIGNIILLSIESINQKGKLQFQKTKDDNNENTPKFTVTMGVMPDYAFDGKGMRIDGVTENKPAFKAGLQKGDIIVKLGVHEVTDIQTYMKALSNFSKGNNTEVEVMRGTQLVKTNVTF